MVLWCDETVFEDRNFTVNLGILNYLVNLAMKKWSLLAEHRVSSREFDVLYNFISKYFEEIRNRQIFQIFLLGQKIWKYINYQSHQEFHFPKLCLHMKIIWNILVFCIVNSFCNSVNKYAKIEEFDFSFQ